MTKFLLTIRSGSIKIKARGEDMNQKAKNTDKFLRLTVCETLNVTCAPKTLRENGRSNYYIMYIFEGCCTVVENGQEIKAYAGSLILYRPGERQEYFFDGNSRAVIYYSLFNGSACEEIINDAGLCKRITAIGASKKQELMFSEIVDEFHTKKPYWKQCTSALLWKFLVDAIRNSEKNIYPTVRHEIYDVIKYMHSNYWENHNVSLFAAKSHLSEGRFSHVFKEITGMSPKQYLQKLKVDNALSLLSSTTLSVSEVASMVGIENANYFTRLLKKHTGATPKSIQK